MCACSVVIRFHTYVHTCANKFEFSVTFAHLIFSNFDASTVEGVQRTCKLVYHSNAYNGVSERSKLTSCMIYDSELIHDIMCNHVVTLGIFLIPSGWHPGVSIQPALHWLYMVQMGFYLHCAYATIYLETIRRDFVVLMMHHVLTLGLLMFSYIVR